MIPQGCSITKGKRIVASRNHPHGMVTWSSNNRPEPLCSWEAVAAFRLFSFTIRKQPTRVQVLGAVVRAWGISLTKNTENVPESRPRPRQEMLTSHSKVLLQTYVVVCFLVSRLSLSSQGSQQTELPRLPRPGFLEHQGRAHRANEISEPNPEARPTLRELHAPKRTYFNELGLF